MILFHTLDAQELNLDYKGLVQFEDMESNVTVRTYPQSLQQSYRQQVENFIDEVSETAGQSNIDYCLLNTSGDLDRALMAYLARRKVLC